jgi:3alpha(or 20beta)-hydroxysteroid dehydrogenase
LWVKLRKDTDGPVRLTVAAGEWGQRVVMRAERLEGKLALVTGAAPGQGEAIARSFVDEGARVVLGDVLDETGVSVAGMARAAALELGVDGIRVNSIHPGTIATPMVNTDEFAHVDRTAYFSAIPAGRVGQPVDVVTLALFLASDESGYCTGSELVVDGGSSTGIRV